MMGPAPASSFNAVNSVEKAESSDSSVEPGQRRSCPGACSEPDAPAEPGPRGRQGWGPAWENTGHAVQLEREPSRERA